MAENIFKPGDKIVCVNNKFEDYGYYLQLANGYTFDINNVFTIQHVSDINLNGDYYISFIEDKNKYFYLSSKFMLFSEYIKKQRKEKLKNLKI